MNKEEEAKYAYYIVGLFGLTCALASYALLFLRLFSFTTQNNAYLIPLCLVVAISVLLVAFMYLNNFLFTSRGQIFLLVCAGVGSLAMLFINEIPFFVPLLGVGITATILLWGSYLCTLSHRELLFATALPFSVVGIIIMLSSVYQGVALAFIIFVFSGLSTCSIFFIRKECFKRTTPITLLESKTRNVSTKKSRYTIISVGLFIGTSSAIIRCIEVPDSSVPPLLLGIPFIAASLLTFALRKKCEFNFEGNYARIFAVIMAACLFPMPFLSFDFQLLFSYILLFFGITSLIVLIAAIAETANFSQVSPFVSFGKEGVFCILSALVSACIVVIGFEGPGFLSPMVACLVIVFIVIVLQVFIGEPIYPVDEHENNKTALLIEYGLPGGKGIWKRKIQDIAEEKNLSPRQIEVMELLAKGRNTKYVAEAFVISFTTAKTHIYNLYQKLGVHTRQELIDMVEEWPIKVEQRK